MDLRWVPALPRIAALAAATALTGCWSTIGPRSVVGERPSYNTVIHDTAMEQTFVNIIRARERQPTLFLDVGEVDVGLQFQTSASANVSLPRGRAGVAGSNSTSTTTSSTTNSVVNSATNSIPFFTGHDATITGTMNYQESPTIRYVPLQGQNLVAQISTPITVDAISSLINSGWPASTLLSIVASRLTPVDIDYYRALAAISYLSDQGFLEVLSEPGGSTGWRTNDALVLYCAPELIAGAVAPAGAEQAANSRATEYAHSLWNRLREIYGLPKVDFASGKQHSSEEFRIVIRSQYRAYKPGESGSGSEKEAGEAERTPTTTQPWFAALPALRMRSALGVLQDMTHREYNYDLAVFVDADVYEHGGFSKADPGKRVAALRPMVRHFAEEIVRGDTRNFYVFDSSPYTGGAAIQGSQFKNDVYDGGVWKYEERKRNLEPADDIVQGDGTEGRQDFDERMNYPDRSDLERHFLIILRQSAKEAPPAKTYVSTVFGDYRYYIDADDLVTQNNFTLVSQLMTIQAVAQTQPLTPTIGVGAQ